MYVIKGTIDSNIAYYVGCEIKELFGGKWEVRVCSGTIKGATKYRTYKEAKKVYDTLGNNKFKIYPVCPMCHKEYEGYPALSRKDNKTKICQTCGVNQAIEDFITYQDNHKEQE